MVLVDHPTAEGILYKGEIVREYENKPNGHIRVKDNMGRIWFVPCLLYTSPSPRDKRQSRMPSSA